MEEKQLKYYKMHHDLQEQIRLGELRSGDRVPSENQLAAAYQVSRQTVRGSARSISLTTLPW